MGNMRVNFYLKDASVRDKADEFHASTGRSLSDIVRQMMSEVVSGDLVPLHYPRARVRTNVSINTELADAFKSKLTELGAPEDCDTRDVLANLIGAFLEKNSHLIQGAKS